MSCETMGNLLKLEMPLYWLLKFITLLLCCKKPYDESLIPNLRCTRCLLNFRRSSLTVTAIRRRQKNAARCLSGVRALFSFLSTIFQDILCINHMLHRELKNMFPIPTHKLKKTFYSNQVKGIV